MCEILYIDILTFSPTLNPNIFKTLELIFKMKYAILEFCSGVLSKINIYGIMGF